MTFKYAVLLVFKINVAWEVFSRLNNSVPMNTAKLTSSINSCLELHFHCETKESLHLLRTTLPAKNNSWNLETFKLSNVVIHSYRHILDQCIKKSENAAIITIPRPYTVTTKIRLKR